jgi:hypothetical protein
VWGGRGYVFFLKKYYDLEGKEIKYSVTAALATKDVLLNIYIIV